MGLLFAVFEPVLLVGGLLFEAGLGSAPEGGDCGRGAGCLCERRTDHAQLATGRKPFASADRRVGRHASGSCRARAAAFTAALAARHDVDVAPRCRQCASRRRSAIAAPISAVPKVQDHCPFHLPPAPVLLQNHRSTQGPVPTLPLHSENGPLMSRLGDGRAICGGGASIFEGWNRGWNLAHQPSTLSARTRRLAWLSPPAGESPPTRSRSGWPCRNESG